MNWIKNHKFWVVLAAFAVLSIILDMTTTMNIARTAGQITGLAIIIKLVTIVVGHNKTNKEANNAKK